MNCCAYGLTIFCGRVKDYFTSINFPLKTLRKFFDFLVFFVFFVLKLFVFEFIVVDKVFLEALLDLYLFFQVLVITKVVLGKIVVPEIVLFVLFVFVLVGVFLSLTVELMGVKSLSFAVGAYLPLSTTAPIFVGGAVKGIADFVAARKKEKVEESELGPGNLFATGLVAGGAIAGVVVAIISANDSWAKAIGKLSLHSPLNKALGSGGYELLGVLFFAVMCFVLYRVSRRKVSE